MTERPKWGEAYIRWREFVPIIISLAIIGATLFGFLWTMQASRIDRVERRNDGRLERIENKLDKLLEK